MPVQVRMMTCMSRESLPRCRRGSAFRECSGGAPANLKRVWAAVTSSWASRLVLASASSSCVPNSTLPCRPPINGYAISSFRWFCKRKVAKLPLFHPPMVALWNRLAGVGTRDRLGPGGANGSASPGSMHGFCRSTAVRVLRPSKPARTW